MKHMFGVYPLVTGGRGGGAGKINPEVRAELEAGFHHITVHPPVFVHLVQLPGIFALFFHLF